MNIRTSMRYLIAIFLILASDICFAAESGESYQEYLSSILPQPIAKTNISEGSYTVAQGRLIVGFAQPSLEDESSDSKALVFLVFEGSKGAITEIGRTPLFDFYTAGGRVLVEQIEFQSPTRFSIQFNHRGACASGFEIYWFSLVANTWRLAGRDVTNYFCDQDDEGVGDTRTEWSGNFLTGRIVSKRFRQNKLVSNKVTKAAFPEFPFSRFVPFQNDHGPR